MSRSLGSLTVDLIARVGGFQDGMSQAERAAQRSGRNISGSMRGASSEIDEMSRRADAAGATLRRFATIAGAAFAGVKLTQLVRDAADLNSRYEQLGGIMNVVGRNAGLSADQVNRYAKEVQAMGITMMESRQTVITMTQAQLDLSRASELARAAQDAAAVAGINSSEALQRIISGIQSNNVEVLRGVGLNVNFEQSYRDMEAQLGRTRGGLNEAEKAQARMNITLEAATQIAGSYEASMDSASKQLGSTARYVEDLQVMWGAMFSEANRQLVFGYSDALKGLLDITEELYSDGSMEEWGRVVNHAMDAATALAVVLGARLAGSLATVAASKALATQQAIAYQLALARMSGTSTAAAASQVALGAAVTAASRAMALVGGPVGVAVIAAAGIYTFREELGLVPPDAAKASSAIEKLTADMDELTAAAARNRKLELESGLERAEAAVNVLQGSFDHLSADLENRPDNWRVAQQLDKVTEQLEAQIRSVEEYRAAIKKMDAHILRVNQGWMSKEDILKKLGGAYQDASSGAGEASEEVAKLIERLEQEQRQLTMTSKELLRYNLLKENATPEEIKHALSLHDTNESLKENQRATDAARKAVEQMLEAEAKASVGRQTTMDATRRQVEVLGRQVSVVGQGRAAQEALNRALHVENQLRSDSYRDLLPHQQEEYRRLIEQQYDLQRELEQQAELAQVYEANWLRGVERVRDGFGDFFERMIVDGKASFSDLTDLFKKMIAEMIATAAANRVMIGLGFMGGSAGAAAGGLGGGSGAGGLGNLFNVAQMANTFKQAWSGIQGLATGQGLAGFSGLGGGLTASIGHWASNAGNMISSGLNNLGLSAMNSAINEAGYRIAEAVGQGVSVGQATLIGSAATAGAGWAGGYAGAGLGRDLFGKEGSGWGATGGAIIGSYWGPAGSALGGLIGGVVDSIFGSSAWNTTRGGLQLGFDESGEFDPMQWTRQTKKGGLFSSTRRRYRFHELDEELDAALRETYSAALDGVREMYGVLGVAVEDGVLEGVQIATLQIGTSGKSKQTQEQIDAQITQWFADLQEAAVQAVDSSLNTETLTLYASSLASVNEVFGAIGLSAYDVSIEGGKAAAQLLALSGGIENLLNATDFYYQNFYSEQERLAKLTEQTTTAFEVLGETLPGSRDEFRQLVESIDQTTEAGQVLFLQLLGLAPAMSTIASATEDAVRAAEELAAAGLDSAFADLRTAVDAEKRLLSELHQLRISALTAERSAVEQAVRDARANVGTVFEAFKRGIDAQREQILQSSQLEIDALSAERDSVLGIYSDSSAQIQAAMSAASASISELSGIVGTLERGIDAMRIQGAQADVYAHERGLSVLQEALGSGVMPDSHVLSRALSGLTLDQSSYASQEDYIRDQAGAAHLASALLSDTRTQLAAEERTVALLERNLSLQEVWQQAELQAIDSQIAMIGEQRDAAVAGLDQQLALAQSQIDSLNGVATNVATLSEVTRAIATYEQTERWAVEQLTALDRQLRTAEAQHAQEIEALDQIVTDGQRQVDAINGTTSAVMSVQRAIMGLESAIEAMGAHSGLQSFSGGGIATGPASGYLAELHGTEAVVPLSGGSIPVRIHGDAGSAASLLRDLRADNAQLRELLTEATRELKAIRNSSSDTAGTLRRIDRIGPRYIEEEKIA